MRLKKTASIFVIVAAMFASCIAIPQLSVPAYAAAKSKKVTISYIVNQNNKATVVWKNGAKKKCVVYVKKGKGKFKKAGTSSKGSFTFKVKVGSSYTVKVQKGKTTSKAIKFLPNNYTAPKIKTMSVYPENGKTIARLTFASKKGLVYAIYRKPAGGKWKRLAFMKGAKTETTFYNAISPTKDYVYTVRRYAKTQKGKIRKYGRFDKDGIKTIVTVPVITTYDATNLQTTLKWNKVSGADGYLTYIKVEKTGTYRQLAKTTKNTYKYKYHSGLKTDAEINSTCGGSSYKYFVDPDSNPFVYTVRAYKKRGSKISYGNHMVDGEYSVITPNVLSYEPGFLTWHTVKNADRYNIYISQDGAKWNLYQTVGAGVERAQTHAVPDARFYGVSSITTKNGVTFESDWDRGFDVSHRTDYTDVNMLWIGCSMEFGSPYYEWNDILHVNSYPQRIAECTGVNFFNPSVPGATMATRYTDESKTTLDTNRSRLLRNVLEHVVNGENTDGPSYIDTKNNMHLYDYDVVAIPAGGNDYTDEIPLGTPDSMDETTYYGALNTAVSWIEEANLERAKLGKGPIKIVFISFLYSDRYKGKYLTLHNRFTTPNDLGYTYSDYQAVMDDVCNRCIERGLPAYLIRTNQYVDAETCPYRSSDNLHMTRFTYSQMGNGIAKEMIERGMLDLEEYIPPDDPGDNPGDDPDDNPEGDITP